MFWVYTIEDTVRIEPKNLGMPTEQAIVLALESTFVDRVILDVGLVVALYDILSIADGFVFHSDGGPHYSVKFRAVIFRPFEGELLVGKVEHMDSEGVRITLGFFSDVRISKDMLQSGSEYTPENNQWTWQYDPDIPPLYMVKGAKVRFKVQRVRFHPLPSLAAQAEQRSKGEPVDGTAERPHVPMELMGRTDGPGLGMLDWQWG